MALFPVPYPLSGKLCGSSLDVLWRFYGRSMATPFFSNSSVAVLWPLNGLCVDVQWQFCGFSEAVLWPCRF